MTVVAAAALVVAGFAAPSDWWAVATGRRTVEYVAKPATLAALVVAALALDPFAGDVRAWVVAALVFSLVGDVVLMLERLPFLGGLAAFLVAHGCYLGAFLVAGQTRWAVVGLVIVTVGLAAVGRPLVGAVAARRVVPLTAGVFVYLVVISAMVVLAFGVGQVVVALAATTFYLSDALLGWGRFVGPAPGGRVGVHVTYHLAQAGFVAWLVVG